MRTGLGMGGEYGGGVSTRESMRGTHCSSAPLSHTTHTFRDQRGRSPQERPNIRTVNKVNQWGRAQDEEERYTHPMNLDQLRESSWVWGHQTDVTVKEMALGVRLMVTSSASVYSVIYSEELKGSSRSSSSHVCTCPHKHTHKHTPSVKTIGGLDRVGAEVHR